MVLCRNRVAPAFEEYQQCLRQILDDPPEQEATHSDIVAPPGGARLGKVTWLGSSRVTAKGTVAQIKGRTENGVEGSYQEKTEYPGLPG